MQFWFKKVALPFQTIASEGFRQQRFQLGPEAGVEPAVHDRIGEGRGERHRVAQSKHEVERLVVLQKERKLSTVRTVKQLNYDHKCKQK